MKRGMSVWGFLLLALACRAELQLSQQGRALQQEPKSSVQWYDLHSMYVAAAEQAVGQNFDLFIYGDSNVEAFRGTGFGKQTARAKDSKRAWTKLVQSRFKTLVLGLAGDRATNLLYRIQNGEGPGEAQPKVIMVMIGTNDLLKADRELLFLAPQAILDQTFAKVQAVLDEIITQAPNSTLVSLGLLPIYPEDEGKYTGLRTLFQPVADALNEKLEALAEARRDQGALMYFHDCSERFFMKGTRVPKAQLMPGGIHVSDRGGWVFVDCLARGLRGALRTRNGGNFTDGPDDSEDGGPDDGPVPGWEDGTTPGGGNGNGTVPSGGNGTATGGEGGSPPGRQGVPGAEGGSANSQGSQEDQVSAQQWDRFLGRFR